VIASPAKLGLLTMTLLLSVSVTAVLGADIQLPQGPGSNLVYAKCQTCHDLQYVVDAKGLLPAQWNAVLASMRDYGLEISDEDKDKVLKYLTTYLGSNPPPANSEVETTKIDGKTVFHQNCATCHGANGEGQPDYFPPLADNPDLFKDTVFPMLVVLNGIGGPITVKGQLYNGSMPSFGYLSDAEIAAVINFIRDTWGNQSKVSKVQQITPELVAEQRNRSLLPSQVHALREEMGSK